MPVLFSKGPPRNILSTCPFAAGVRVDHTATPTDPGPARKIDVGGDGETDDLGFEEFVTYPGVVDGPPPPETDLIVDGSVSDIALRSSPFTTRGEGEIRRMAMPGARLRIATNTFALPSVEAVVQRLGGAVIDTISLPDPTAIDGLGIPILVGILP